jgi:hypothetical protein
MNEYKRHPASFRDPSGFIFEKDGLFYRQVNLVYRDQYDLLMQSGLYDKLTKEGRMISHEALDENLTGTDICYNTLLPRQLPAISWPYEWCFSQWKAAALLTLSLLKEGLEYGLILKDATPFNIQYEGWRPLLIDSLSFEKYDPSKPWVAYRQFLECFLAPLVLAGKRDAALLKLFQLYPEGIPLDLVSKQLPMFSKWNPGIFLHLVLPLMMTRSAKPGVPQTLAAFNKNKLLNIANSLSGTIDSLKPASLHSHWSAYYEKDVATEYTAHKQSVVEQWLKNLPDEHALDLGTNTGMYAKMAAALGKNTIAIDADIACIEEIFHDCQKQRINNLLPLCVDISQPSPAIGWSNKERADFGSRIKPGTTMALALVHHLAIGRNLGFALMANYFAAFSKHLIIEFVPNDDSKVKMMLASREAPPVGYDQPSFLSAFQDKFEVMEQLVLNGSKRTIFLMRRR